MLNRCVFRYSSCFVLEFQEVLKDKWKVEMKKEGGQAGMQAGREGADWKATEAEQRCSRRPVALY